MKKMKTFLCSAALLSLGTLTLVSCGKIGGTNIGGGNSSTTSNTPSTSVHTCDFTLQTVEEEYLKEAATCETKAVYYYSCSCGEKGEETFEHGEELGHDYAQSYIWEDAQCS